MTANHNTAQIDESVLPKKKSPAKIISSLLKILLTLGMLYIVFIKADVPKMAEYVKRADIFYLTLALIALNLGQIASGLRMRFYFATENLHLSRYFSISLYYVGMLFNLLLPGGIGGDGYKAYYIYKKRHFSLAKAIRMVIAQRANGLLVLVIFTLLLAYFSPAAAAIPYSKLLITISLIFIFPCYSFLAKLLFKEPVKTQTGALKYSVICQAAVVISAVLLLYSVGYQGDMTDYVVLFMISSIMSVLPVSFGGIGLREATFFFGASYMNLDPELGVIISVLYFVINTLASLIGVLFFYNLGKIDK